MRKALDAQARIGDAAERRRRESARPAAPANPPAASSSAAPAPRTPRDASAAPQDTGANEDVDMAEAGEPADTAFDWDYAILSEDEVEPGEWNDVAEEVDLVETTALIKNTTPKRASDAGTRPRSTGKPPVAPAATSTGGRSGLAGIASSLARPANVRGSSQLSQRRGNENAASRANSDRAASKVPADARELLALATTAEDRRQILTALNMASGVVGIAFQLHKVKNDVSKLAAAVRRLVFTEEEDNLIEHYRDEAELMDLADRHGADLVNKR
ncbi:hypothetical protein DFJ74DRAFT_495095 [Hyaloraphidium curvatum]|nr:hypothetical protein DFJ74DRAFT_495095 [Hyaloraphidium curvatum]